jgi:hypothetical protein
MDLQQRLDHYPEAWRPDPGDKVVGEIIELDMLESKFGGSYPLVVIETEDNRQVALHGFHTVFKSELARQCPKVGDRIGVAYHGRDEKAGYERYRVVVERTEPQSNAIDWQAVDADARAELGDAPPLSDADAPVEDGAAL